MPHRRPTVLVLSETERSELEGWAPPKTATVIVLNCPPVVIQNAYHPLCLRRNAGAPSPPRGHVIAGSRALQVPCPLVSKGIRAAQQGHHESTDAETVDRIIGPNGRRARARMGRRHRASEWGHEDRLSVTF